MPNVRVATFNAENLGPDLAPARVPVLRSALSRARADVLCLQEVLPSPGSSHPLRALDAVVAGTPYES
jgi:endonuclease/exonuclease/phosphatase family metal-dependent hydrolase